ASASNSQGERKVRPPRIMTVSLVDLGDLAIEGEQRCFGRPRTAADDESPAERPRQGEESCAMGLVALAIGALHQLGAAQPQLAPQEADPLAGAQQQRGERQ